MKTPLGQLVCVEDLETETAYRVWHPPLRFSYIKNMLKDQLFKISGLQFDDWLFGPEKFSGLSRNRLLDRGVPDPQADLDRGVQIRCDTGIG